jgi:hypothetical protein
MPMVTLRMIGRAKTITGCKEAYWVTILFCSRSPALFFLWLQVFSKLHLKATKSDLQIHCLERWIGHGGLGDEKQYYNEGSSCISALVLKKFKHQLVRPRFPLKQYQRCGRRSLAFLAYVMPKISTNVSNVEYCIPLPSILLVCMLQVRLDWGK